jgi:adenylate cyclase
MTLGGNRMLDKLNALLEENLDNFSLSPDTLCQRLGLSRAQLHRLVKQESQLSVTLYIRQKKLDKAKTLLMETDLRVSEIAYLVGIESPQNFSKYFTAAFQTSPTDFRKQAETQKQANLTLAAATSIAVLPFVNMSNDPGQEYFSDGISEEIINVLSHVPRLNVAGRTSSFTFKGKNQDLRLIGEQLNVEHVLEGSVRKWGERLRITAQLVKVEDGYHLWSENYDRELKDIFDIQDEIALAILKAVKIQLLGEEQGSPLKRYTNNPEAYQLYLHGRFYHSKFAGAEEFNQAIEYYQAALALEPTYAIAYAGIASCYLNLWFYRHLPSEQCLPLMKQATEQALQLDSQMAESHLAMARMQMLYEWDFKSAAVSFKKAIEFNWNAAELYGQYALYWSILGQHSKADEQAALALSLEPFSLINNFYAGYVYWAAGDFDRAIAQGRRLVALEPAFWGGHSVVGLNLITLQRYDEAHQALENALHLNYNGMTLSACGVLYALSGEQDKAQDTLVRMLALHQTHPVANYDLGIVHACLGELDMACGYFTIAVENHEPPMLFFKYIVRDWLAPFAQDERYHALITQVVG